MGENGETTGELTGGGGGPNPIDEVDEVLEAQNRERRINEFSSKLTRVREDVAWDLPGLLSARAHVLLGGSPEAGTVPKLIHDTDIGWSHPGGLRASSSYLD